ncbi:MAG: BrxA/BrxB family bacilliredoxin [Planctomycetes bacterium]|nr:BrxA/BrxB family bacilliredoxin [Planctomycetota bacterium]
MPYDPDLVQPMKDEVTRLGVKELTDAQAVDAALKDANGTALVFVNSVCGCAAGRARPALELALQHKTKPDRTYTVFAGQDVEATAQARSYFAGQPPSSPSIALFKEGKLVTMVHRHMIEGRDATEIAGDLAAAFDKHCAKK